MAINPSGGGNAGPHPSDVKKPSAKRARRLMSCLIPNYFHINYSLRLELVRVLAVGMALPEFDAVGQAQQQHHRRKKVEEAVDTDSPLFDGALFHLRASLNAFAAGALSDRDAHWARRALVNIAVYTGHELFISEELVGLVSLLTSIEHQPLRCRCVENGGQLKRRGHDLMYPISLTSLLARGGRNELGCLYIASGELLENFIMRHNGCRHYADGVFTKGALESLTNGIAVLTERMKRRNVEKIEQDTPSPCQVSSLLGAVRAIFFFLLDPKAQAEEASEDTEDQFADAEEDDSAPVVAKDKDEDRNKDILMKCAIQLLGHQDINIAQSASSLLSLAFAYGGKDFAEGYTKGLFLSVCGLLSRCDENDKTRALGKGVIRRDSLAIALQGVITTVSRQSRSFAGSLLVFLLKLYQQKSRFTAHCLGSENILRLISSIALSQPYVFSKQIEALGSIKNFDSGSAVSHLISTFLSCRFLHVFSSEETVSKCQKSANELLHQISDPTTLMKLAHHAFATANFGIAEEIYGARLLSLSSTEQSYLWLTALSRAARAESIIAEKGSLGIPEALPNLYAAKSHIHSLSSLFDNGALSGPFLSKRSVS